MSADKTALAKVEETGLAAQGIQEVKHLQAAFIKEVKILDPSLLVVSDEYNWFEGAKRRIDLLCVDHEGRLVVVELKRTADAGHSELQALRYAAMVSTMTFDQVVDAYVKHAKKHDLDVADREAARSRILEWIGWMADGDDDEPTLGDQVRIVLASENFSTEVTATVLWLNTFEGMDITCIRLAPYVYDGKVLLDVQRLIPLPEAEEYMVRIKEKEIAQKRAGGGMNRDQYIVTYQGADEEPRGKGRTVLRLVEILMSNGMSPEEIKALDVKLESAPVAADAAEAWEAFRTLPHVDERRWFKEPIKLGSEHWFVTNQWGNQAVGVMEGLCAARPGIVSYRLSEGPI